MSLPIISTTSLSSLIDSILIPFGSDPTVFAINLTALPLLTLISTLTSFCENSSPSIIFPSSSIAKGS